MISCLCLQLVCFSLRISLHWADVWVLVSFLELGLKEHCLFGPSQAWLNCKNFSVEINLLGSNRSSFPYLHHRLQHLASLRHIRSRR